jgi:hypothetical protein
MLEMTKRQLAAARADSYAVGRAYMAMKIWR